MCVYQSRISSTHEFYIMINIVNKTKKHFGLEKEITILKWIQWYWGKVRHGFLLLLLGAGVDEWKWNRQHVSHTQLTLSEKQKLSIQIEHFCSLFSVRSIFPMVSFAIIQMQKLSFVLLLYGQSLCEFRFIHILVYTHILYYITFGLWCYL